MTPRDDAEMSEEASLQCDCGYQCRGESADDRIRDAQRHAREVHGIEVSPDQILKEAGTA